MLSKRMIQPVENEDNSPDEGWWSAILADEEVYSSAPKEANTSRPGGRPSISSDNWDRIRKIYDQDEIIQLTVQGYNRGGLLVEGDGLQGFVPVSHLVAMPNGLDDEERRRILTGYVGKNIELKVIECEPDQERVVFSERAALAGEGRRKLLFHSLKPGENVCGTVTNVTEFGAFVDLGGLEGLIHVSELSWGRVQHPRDVLNVGEEIHALVLQVSEENGRVALSLKRLVPNPWDTINDYYHPGDVVYAVVTGITRYGAFARLDEGVEGLIHISSLENKAGQSNMSSLFKTGQRIQVKILHIDAEKRRLGLSLVMGEEPDGGS
jgi:small subunit ribosomal protein S1